MFSMFRRKAKHTPSVGQPPPKRSAPTTKPARLQRPSIEGYTIQELETREIAHAIRLARLTPDQLMRVLNANDKRINAQSSEGRPQDLTM
jgi:hypothetical protein